MASDASSLQPGRDYPSDWVEFVDWFPDEAACLHFLENLRWPHGFSCPYCRRTAPAYTATRGRRICRSCRRQSSVTRGTIFDKTRTPLRSWFAAVWYITNQKYGCSALGLQRVLGLGSYQTAWTMLHRLRRAMARAGRERLTGTIEVDETFVGGERKGKNTPRKGSYNGPIPRTAKSVVVVAVEVHEPKGFGRVRLGRVDRKDREHVMPFVLDTIKPGSRVITDGSWAYRSLPEHGYHRQTSNFSASEDPAHVVMPGVHRVSALVKRWLLGTDQGSIKPDQLDHYLDEFTSRFNRRSSRSRGLLFYRLLEQAIETEPVPHTKTPTLWLTEATGAG